MGHRFLACQAHSWCTHGHVVAWIPAVIGGIFLVLVIAGIASRARNGR